MYINAVSDFPTGGRDIQVGTSSGPMSHMNKGHPADDIDPQVILTCICVTVCSPIVDVRAFT